MTVRNSGAAEGRLRNHLLIRAPGRRRCRSLIRTLPATARRCRAAGSRGHPGPAPRRRLALAARRGGCGDHLPLHQPAVRPAVLRRLHAAQHRVLLRAGAGDAAVRVRDLPGQRARAPGPRRLVRRGAVPGHRRDRGLPDAAHPQGGGAGLGVRRRAGRRRLGRLRHVGAAHGGPAAHRRLGAGALGAAVHALPAVRRRRLARAAQGHAIDARAGERLPHAVGGRACSASRCRPSPRR